MNAANQKLTEVRDVFPISEKEPVKTIMGTKENLFKKLDAAFVCCV